MGAILVVVFGVVFLGMFSCFLLALLLYSGVLLAPFAGLLCAWAARRRGLNTRYYGITGALCSILLFLPGIYLTVSLLGKSVSATLVRVGYSFLYFIWLFGSVGLAFVLLLTGFLGPETEATARTETQAKNALFAFLIGSGLLWFLSLVLFLKVKVWGEYYGKELALRESLVPAFGYLLPFVLALINFILFILVVHYSKPSLYEGLLPLLPI